MSQPAPEPQKMNGCLVGVIVAVSSAVILAGWAVVLFFGMLTLSNPSVSGKGWEELFYENEAQINYVNDNLLYTSQLALKEGSIPFVSEITADGSGRDILVTVTNPLDSREPPVYPLDEAPGLSEEDREAIRALCQGMRLRGYSASFTHNRFALTNKDGLGPVYRKWETWLEMYGGEIDENQWVLWGTTRHQYFDNPPEMYTSPLPDQQPWE